MTASGRLATLIATLGFALLALNHFTPHEVDNTPQITIINDLPTPVPDVEDVFVKLDQSEFECMRTNIYYEARNQKSDVAFAAVGYSVMNRVGKGRYPKTLCGVIKEKRFVTRKNRWVCQYSWFCDGKADIPQLTITQKLRTKSGKVMTRVVPNKAEIAAWNRAGEIAAAVMRKQVDNPIGNATMYHATYVSPKWDFNKLIQVAHIETHIYYKTKA